MKRQRTRQVIAYAIATLLVLALTFTCVAACGSFDIGQGDKTELTDGTISSVDSAYTSKSSVYTSSESLLSSDHHALKSSFISHLSSDRETTKTSKSSKDDRTTAKSTGRTSPTTCSQEFPPTTTTASTTRSEFIDVTVFVECRNAVKHHAFKDKIEWMIVNGYCDADGLMFEDTVRLKRGETVFDALVKTELQVLYRTTIFSKYVYEINRLREKDCSQSRSGWVYLVNDAFGQVSSDAWILNDNDRVHWGYTIVEGDVK